MITVGVIHSSFFRKNRNDNKKKWFVIFKHQRLLIEFCLFFIASTGSNSSIASAILFTVINFREKNGHRCDTKNEQ
jgi:hypothetical protein